VRDGEGNPVPGAEVSLSQSVTVVGGRGGGGRAMLSMVGGAADLPRGRSDAAGRFEVRGVAAATTRSA
jgi:hypothetical protein